MGTVLPSTTLVNAEIASSAASIKSLNFYWQQELLLVKTCLYFLVTLLTSLDCTRSLNTSSSSLKKNFISLVTISGSVKYANVETKLGYITVDRKRQKDLKYLRVMRKSPENPYPLSG
jgi:hypothetical protein